MAGEGYQQLEGDNGEILLTDTDGKEIVGDECCCGGCVAPCEGATSATVVTSGIELCFGNAAWMEWSQQPSVSPNGTFVLPFSSTYDNGLYCIRRYTLTMPCSGQLLPWWPATTPFDIAELQLTVLVYGDDPTHGSLYVQYGNGAGSYLTVFSSAGSPVADCVGFDGANDNWCTGEDCYLSACWGSTRDIGVIGTASVLLDT